ncbi:hypothetical protein KFK09_008217 [Dendrobium nobile]|uniref:Auxin-responsive protein n=1 Tax=Dendrobium nobile TaxID=94219 RepID=A0A8T3BN19_DENNO|nr:hypothetical protein KFK09_008217 [Dendrobium nobile]
MTPPLEHYYMGMQELSPDVCSGKPFTSSPASSGDGGVVEEEGEKIGLNLKETELRLGLPGSDSPERMDGVGLSLGMPRGIVAGAKRGFNAATEGVGQWDRSHGSGTDGGKLFWPVTEKEVGTVGKQVEKESNAADRAIGPAAKAQVVGWPPIRNYRKNTMATSPMKSKEDGEGKPGTGCLFVKVSMDGAPYLRKVDLKTYSNYKEMSIELGTMFSSFTIGYCGSQVVPAKDGLTESRLVDLLHGSDYALTYEDKDGDWMLVGDVPWEMFRDSCRRLRIMKGSDAIGFAPRSIEKRA